MLFRSTCLLTREEKIQASLAAKNAGADFVKTSTGFSTAGATRIGASAGVKIIEQFRLGKSSATPDVSPAGPYGDKY